ncbi:hypothetical protein DN069_33245 [Streptacidiphilus pinicola]|uniref:Uncharacterized protein n=1 Tax=Streptacidiphilus pinicola TaxID=2219663 RepID=A0A2X0K1E4_9ACTN|nr:hypothetical protein DN069_33245 [Streptacidiphilus pinicola]
MGVDHGVANLERHVTGTPSVAFQSNTLQAVSEGRFRRSELVRRLDNGPASMLRPLFEKPFSQVGAVVHEPARTPSPCNDLALGALFNRDLIFVRVGLPSGDRATRATPCGADKGPR